MKYLKYGVYKKHSLISFDENIISTTRLVIYGAKPIVEKNFDKRKTEIFLI